VDGGAGDGTILYIDPNDPQAAEILQQAGLRLTDEGTVASLVEATEVNGGGGVTVGGGATTTTTTSTSSRPSVLDMPDLTAATATSEAAVTLGSLGELTSMPGVSVAATSAPAPAPAPAPPAAPVSEPVPTPVVTSVPVRINNGIETLYFT